MGRKSLSTLKPTKKDMAEILNFHSVEEEAKKARRSIQAIYARIRSGKYYRAISFGGNILIKNKYN